MRKPITLLYLALLFSLIFLLAGGNRSLSFSLPDEIEAVPQIAQRFPPPSPKLPPDLMPQRKELLAAWRSAVARHDAGIMDSAAMDISAWLPYKLSFVVDQVCRLSASLSKAHLPGEAGQIRDLLGLSNEEAERGNANRILKRGALLLTDIAVSQPEGTAGFPFRGSQLLIDDGLPVGQRNESLYWALARQLLSAIRPSPANDGMVWQWYLATSADMQQRRRWGDAILHLKQALKIFPGDAFFCLYAGAVHEFFASPIVQNIFVMTPNSSLEVESRERELKLSQLYFQLAVDADGDFAEAPLRLGRVAGLLGNHAMAVATLGNAAASLTERPLQYYAELFLGREYESRGEYTAARARYEKAAGLYPAAQTPLLALNYLMRWSTDYPKYFSEMEQILRQHDATAHPPDPWWNYDVSHVRNADALMAQMREAIGELPR